MAPRRRRRPLDAAAPHPGVLILADEGLARFGAVVAEPVRSGDVPGVVALVAHGEQVHVETHGVATLGGPPIRRDTVFRIASVTKPVAAAAVGTLLADGLLELDEPVDRLLPELADLRVLRTPDAALDDVVPAAGPLTVRHVLTSTTGWGMTTAMFGADPPWPWIRAASAGRLSTIGPPRPDETAAPDAWLAELAGLPLLAQPGERWLYHASSQLLGVLAARAAGLGLPDLLATRVLDPLGMSDTAFAAPVPDRLATAYERGPDGGLEVWDPPTGRWSAPPAFPDAAAGLLSTADDLLAFSRMLTADGGDVLEPEYVAAMTSDRLTPSVRADGAGFLDADSSWGYGTAVTVRGPRTGSIGWAGGLGTSWHVDPARDLVVVVLTQRMFAAPDDLAVHTRITDAAYATFS